MSGLNFEYAGHIKTQGAVGTIIAGMRGLRQGTRRLISNLSSGLTIKHNAVSSAAGNRFYCPGGVDYVLLTYASVWAIYDAANAVWLLET